MILNESIQDDVIVKFKNVMEAYENFKDAASTFKNACEDEQDLSFDAKYLYDFISEEVYERLDNTKDSILDTYYPIYDDADSDDNQEAIAKYHDSVELRDSIFSKYF